MPRRPVERDGEHHAVHVAHQHLHALHYVGDMRERKAGLARRGDAFVALPGGYGTLEEVSEILVERQLRFHAKPLVLISPDDFWGPLRALFERMAGAELLGAPADDVCRIVPDADAALALLDASLAARARTA